MRDFAIRRARPGEAGFLSELALRSKASWKYPPSMLEARRPELVIRPAYIESAVVIVAEVEEEIVGFAGLSLPTDPPELVYCFVAPEWIGRGVGRRLWEASLEEARRLGWDRFRIVADRNAERFYLNRGARRVGETESAAWPGRKLPVLELELSAVR